MCRSLLCSVRQIGLRLWGYNRCRNWVLVDIYRVSLFGILELRLVSELYFVCFCFCFEETLRDFHLILNLATFPDLLKLLVFTFFSISTRSSLNKYSTPFVFLPLSVLWIPVLDLALFYFLYPLSALRIQLLPRLSPPRASCTFCDSFWRHWQLSFLYIISVISCTTQRPIKNIAAFCLKFALYESMG